MYCLPYCWTSDLFHYRMDSGTIMDTNSSFLLHGSCGNCSEHRLFMARDRFDDVFFLFINKPIFIFLFGLPFLLEFGFVGTSCDILICMVCNDKMGFIQRKWQKYIFYMYYPLHLVAIWCLLHLC